jgi:DNA polymerase
VVFGSGKPSKPRIAFVGEAPGKNEDETGEPFIGKAGILLDSMISAMKLKRDDLYICNVVNCRPPENRTPYPDEVVACSPFLFGQLRAVEPECIVALGASAARALLRAKRSIKDMRGKWHDWEGIPLRVTFHPAFLLRDPQKKREAWGDLQEVMAKLRIS